MAEIRFHVSKSVYKICLLHRYENIYVEDVISNIFLFRNCYHYILWYIRAYNVTCFRFLSDIYDITSNTYWIMEWIWSTFMWVWVLTWDKPEIFFSIQIHLALPKILLIDRHSVIFNVKFHVFILHLMDISIMTIKFGEMYKWKITEYKNL